MIRRAESGTLHAADHRLRLTTTTACNQHRLHAPTPTGWI